MFVSARTLKPLLTVAANITPVRFGKSYSCILFRPNERGQQELVATDLETTLIVQLDTTGEPIEMAVSGKFLAALVGMYEDTLEITTGAGKIPELFVNPLDVKQTNTLRGVDPADFPSINQELAADMQMFAELSGREMVTYIDRLKATAGKNEMEYVVFTGDIVQSYNKYSFTYRDVQLAPKVLRIPLGAFLHLRALVQSTEERIQVLSNTQYVQFRGPSFSLTVELGSGTFLDASQFKTGEDSLVIVRAADMQRVLKVVNGSTGVLTFSVGEGDTDVLAIFYSQDGEELFRFTFAHQTPTDVVKPFTLTVTAPVLRPIIDGLGKEIVGFGTRVTPTKVLVGLVVSGEYGQVFAPANPAWMKAA